MFLGVPVDEPDDVLIYGHSLAFKYVQQSDDASAAEIVDRPWKTQWHHYIRVRDAHFLPGTLGEGVSLNALIHHSLIDSSATGYLLLEASSLPFAFVERLGAMGALTLLRISLRKGE